MRESSGDTEEPVTREREREGGWWARGKGSVGNEMADTVPPGDLFGGEDIYGERDDNSYFA